MLEPSNNSELPPIPGKRYFTIGEVSDLCGVKPHVLRYWEQEFPQLKPVKRRGNRRYYQRQDVLIIRQIRSLLYEQGFTIGGARNRLTGDDAQVDLNQSQQLIHQMRLQLEGLIKILRPWRAAEHKLPKPFWAIIRSLGRGVAQPGSALAWGARGRKFESCRPDQFLAVYSGHMGNCLPGLINSWSVERATSQSND